MREGKRVFVFDLMRGAAVFLMILAHCVYFFHDRSQSFLTVIESFGNTFCYSIFLFVAGAVATIAYLQGDGMGAETRHRLKKRLLVFLISYYFLALFVQSPAIISASGVDKLKIIFEILTFRLLPSYTEFIPPFAVYSALVLLFPRALTKMIQKPLSIFFAAIIVYVGGHLLYSLNLPPFLAPWKAFLVGSQGFYRFPILQYGAVFLFGIWWGNVVISKAIYSRKKDLSLNIGAVLVLILLLILVSNKFTISEYQTIFSRWPPSLGFILLGLSMSFGLTYFFYKSNMFKKARLLRDFLLLLGQNAFPLLWAQIIFLQLYSFAGGAKTDSILIFIFLFIVTLCVSLAVATFVPFNFRFGLTFGRKSLEEEENLIEEEMLFKFGGDLYENLRQDAGKIKTFFFPDRTGLKDRRRLKKRHLIAIALLALLTFNILAPMAQEEIKTNILANESNWWSEDYGYFMEIKIENEEPFSSLNRDEVIKFNFDSTPLLNQNKLLLDGSDIAVVYWNGKKYQNTKYSFSNSTDPARAELSFALVDEIGPKKNITNYYLYYGNPIAKQIDFSAVKFADSSIAHKYAVSLSEEVGHKFVIAPEKKWNLIENNSPAKVTLTLATKEELNSPEITYTASPGNITGTFSQISSGKWRAEVPSTNLKPGAYSVRAKIIDNGVEYFSQRSGFYVSYPVYFSWTLDWEGYDVSSKYLDNISEVSTKYTLPITHYFNPRIYMTDISPSRRQFLTDWLKKRLQAGDGFGLHLHMFYDFVSAAGVTPKTEPNWGDNGDGYGALTTNYTEEEMSKILAYAKSLFAQNGLPTPIFYRAGGWFANTPTLKSLHDSGFVADSSGRTEYHFGRNNQQGFWNLESNAAPFFPSIYDQNHPAEAGKQIGIMEIPNNGSDTYWYSADELIGRFKENYAGGIVESPRAVTFLSHPQWYKDEEMNKTDQYMSFVDGYNNYHDYGPVIYCDVNQIFNTFKK